MDGVEDDWLRGVAVEFVCQQKVEAAYSRLEVLNGSQLERSAPIVKSSLSAPHQCLSLSQPPLLVCPTSAAVDVDPQAPLHQILID